MKLDKIVCIYSGIN